MTDQETMLHGRRPHENRTPHRAPRKGQRRRAIHLFNRSLQGRYAATLGVTTLAMVAIFAGTAWYFIQENYNLFNRIAYDTHPALIAHLDRERAWIACLLILASITAGLMAFITTLRVTTVLLGPLYAMERHMLKAIRGDWSAPEFRVRDREELGELIGTYAYLYRTLRVQSETELKLLETIAVDPRHLPSAQAVESLLHLKRQQLGLTDATAAETFSSQDSRHAS